MLEDLARLTVWARLRPAAAALALFAGIGFATSTPQTVAAASPFSLPGWTWYKQAYPLDCEAAALQMALRYEGFATGQATILGRMGADTRSGYYDSNGTLRWGNAYKVFVGNVNGSEPKLTGYGTYWPVVERVAQSYNSNVVLSAGTGISPSTVYADVRAGDPVQVWVTWDWAAHGLGHWLTFDGSTWVAYAGPVEHSLDIIGVSDTQVLVADPMGGQGFSGHPSPTYWLNKSTFESSYNTYQDMAVVYAPVSAGLGWIRLPGSAHDVGSGGGTLVAIGTDQQSDGYGIWRWDGSAWHQFPGSGVRIAADTQGNPWVVNKAGLIWRWDGSAWQSVPDPPDPADSTKQLEASDIGVSPNGSVFVIASNVVTGGFGIWEYTSGSWQQFPGGGIRISMDASGNPWVVNATQQLWAWNGAWALQTVTAQDVGAGPQVWIASTQSTDGGGSPEMLDGGTWWAAGGGITNAAAGSAGEVYATNSSFMIWEHLSI